MTEGASGAPERGALPPDRRRLLLMLAGGVVGGAIIGGVVGSVVAPNDSTGAARIDSVPTSALPQVRGTLSPDQATRLIEQARGCREPLGHVTISHSPGMRGGMVSIVSGSYRSPRFVLTDTPSLVALPYPAPYSAGRGVLTLIGEASDIVISLKPQRIIDLKESVPLPVFWIPVAGCP